MHGFKPAEGDKEPTTNEGAIDKEGMNDGATRGKGREKRRRSLEGCQQDDGNNIRWWRTGDETTEGSLGRQVRGSDLTECQHG